MRVHWIVDFYLHEHDTKTLHRDQPSAIVGPSPI
jgi:hypothetical protein